MPRLNAAQSFYSANSSSREAEIDLTKQKYEHAGYERERDGWRGGGGKGAAVTISLISFTLLTSQ